MSFSFLYRSISGVTLLFQSFKSLCREKFDKYAMNRGRWIGLHRCVRFENACALFLNRKVETPLSISRHKLRYSINLSTRRGYGCDSYADGEMNNLSKKTKIIFMIVVAIVII